MIHDEEEFEIISDSKHLKSYLHHLRKKGTDARLRYIAHTSLNGLESVIIRIPHPKWEYDLFVPYIPKGGDSRRLVIKQQSLKDLTYKGVQREAGFFVRRMHKVTTVSVRNTDRRISVENHLKHLVVVTSYEKYSHTHRTQPFFKDGPPVWVARSLMKGIFQEKIGEEYHPQYQSFQMYLKVNR